MPETLKFLAFDLGAESGRAVIGLFDGQRLQLEDVHRFPNGPVRVLDSIHWDVLRLWSEMKQALGMCAKAHGPELEGIGVDTWGVDFGLLGGDDQLLGNPFHYRDKRTDGMMEKAFAIVPRDEIFQQTGIQFMPLNTLFQIFAMAQADSPALRAAATLLMMPDLFNFWLTGEKVSEFSIATTTQFYDPTGGDWARGMLQRLGVRSDILPDIVPPGSVLGDLLSSVGDETGIKRATVIAPACHDTAAAVAAVPARGAQHC
ncbi:MAG: rhamnulokinase family protein, partial [Armatimonadota bacterium]